jgi:branched-chain amino acid transport system ATP-binding protein
LVKPMNSPSDPLLEIKDLHTYYGRSHVIQGLSLTVQPGETVSILGRNGVGKTTTLRTIIGLTPPKSGTIWIDGEDTTHWPPHRIARKGVAYIPAERHIFPGLSVEENLRLAAKSSGAEDSWNVERVFDQFPILRERKRQDGSTLSGGEQQMLAIGRGLMSNPRMMLLDEPSQGLSPLLVKMVIEIVLRFCADHGLTLLIVEQNYKMALRVASRHYLMDIKGVVTGTASTDELRADPSIIQRHLSV